MMPGVLVTGIGGNVGQGILRNVRTSGIECRLIGCDIGRFPAGAFYCDAFRQVPYAIDDSYLNLITAICEEEGINLVIPATDHEAAVLSEWGGTSSTTVLASPAETCRLSLDKWSTAEACRKHSLPFAESWLPSQYPGSGNGVIAKPRQGRGSRGIICHPSAPQNLSDEEYLLQTLYEGIEITTAAYVDRQGRLHGQITMARSLEKGMTERCEVVNSYDEQVRVLCTSYIAALGFRGAFNLQSIVTADGGIYPFEINCRYSGTNSIRSQFGFTDVKWGIEEFLLRREPSPAPSGYAGSAVRIMLDIVYPGKSLDEARCHPNSGRIY